MDLISCTACGLYECDGRGCGDYDGDGPTVRLEAASPLPRTVYLATLARQAIHGQVTRAAECEGCSYHEIDF